MEYASVTFTAYLSAAIVAGLLTATYLYQFLRQQQGYAFTLAAAIHTVLLSTIAIGLHHNIFSSNWLLVAECLHFNAWSLAIAMTLRHHSKSQQFPRSLRLLFYGPLPVTGLILLATLFTNSNLYLLTPLIALALAVIGLVSIEQLYRFIAINDRQIKLLCMNLGAIFIFDVYLFTYCIIFREIDPMLWQSRAAVSIVTCLFMALGGLIPLQNSQQNANFNISRPIAFYTTSLIGIGILITLLSLGGYYVRLYGGNWGTIIYSFVLIAAVLLIATVFMSSSLRLRLAVLINKHLFRHKYDYRSEWLRVINYLAQHAESSEVNKRAFFAAASVMRTPGGALWLLKQGFYEPVYQFNLSDAIDLYQEPANSPFCRALLESEWVYFPDANVNEAIGHNNNLLPDWAHHFPNLWLIFPLIIGEELVGFIALTKPQEDTTLTWEDLDLLKTIGRQLASYLRRHQQAEQLAVGRQFDTYNKLAAFIIHDLNNLIAQQALMVKNAEKHKDNPAFVEDAIKTISHSVDRMNNLLKKLRRDESDLVKSLNISDVVKHTVRECHHNKVTLITDIEHTNRTINADHVRLTMTLTNFIKNAQEASAAGGEVHVTLALRRNWAVITIADSGVGMDWDFVNNRLFKPFDTTKSGKGMGIGVYLSREYIKELGGTLNVISAVGEGTTINISLPLNKMD